jgi:hypothetical protein
LTNLFYQEYAHFVLRERESQSVDVRPDVLASKPCPKGDAMASLYSSRITFDVPPVEPELSDEHAISILGAELDRMHRERTDNIDDMLSLFDDPAGWDDEDEYWVPGEA